MIDVANFGGNKNFKIMEKLQWNMGNQFFFLVETGFEYINKEENKNYTESLFQAEKSPNTNRRFLLAMT